MTDEELKMHNDHVAKIEAHYQSEIERLRGLLIIHGKKLEVGIMHMPSFYGKQVADSWSAVTSAMSSNVELCATCHHHRADDDHGAVCMCDACDEQHTLWKPKMSDNGGSNE